MSTGSHSERLRGTIALVYPELVEAGTTLLTHPHVADLYPEYLFVLHSAMRASVTLMQAALERCRALGAADPVAVILESYLASHIGEERGHDEWVLQDYEALGFKRADLLGRMPSSTVAELVGAQYYWIFHYHPVALLGYMELAEGYPPRVQQIDALRHATGFPKQAFRALTRHAYLDLNHRRDLHQTMDRLPLTQEQSGLIGVSALQSVHLFSRALREPVEQYTPELIE